MISSFFSLILLPTVLGNSSPLNLVSTPNASSLALPRLTALNVTNLTTHNDCFEKSSEHSWATNKLDCERALDRLVAGKSLVEPHWFAYEGRRATDKLPVEVTYGTCSIALLTFNLHTRIMITYAEIYAELLGPDGLIKDCLGPDVPFEEAFGGQTAMGPDNMLVADVTGRLYRATDQKTR